MIDTKTMSTLSYDMMTSAIIWQYKDMIRVAGLRLLQSYDRIETLQSYDSIETLSVIFNKISTRFNELLW
jgi:hypothetical protein